MLLADKIAVVTGASRGIGRGIALAMAREGATVVVNYNGSKERAEEVVAEIENAGGKAVAKQCNVSDFSQAKEFFAEVVKEYGRIDILVNNAGITRDNLIMKMSNLSTYLNELRSISPLNDVMRNLPCSLDS